MSEDSDTPRARPADDPFRRLSIACGVIVAAGDAVRFDHWEKADAAFMAIRWDELGSVDIYYSQRLLADVYRMVRRLGWSHDETREMLWATLKFYALAQSCHHDKGTAEANPKYWWQEDRS